MLTRYLEGGFPRKYEAVHVLHLACSSRTTLATAVASFMALALLGSVLLGSEDDSQPSAQAVSEAVASLSVMPVLKDSNLARGVKVQALYPVGATTKQGTAPGSPGVMPSGTPPPGGYNIFDPHYSLDGPLEHGATKGVFTGHRYKFSTVISSIAI